MIGRSDALTRAVVRRVAHRARRRSLTIEGLQDELSSHVSDIRALFEEPVHVSIVVRNPAHPDHTRDVFLGNDNGPLAIETVRALTEAAAAGSSAVRCLPGTEPCPPAPAHPPVQPLRSLGVRLMIRSEGDQVHAYLGSQASDEGAFLVASISRGALADEQLWQDWRQALTRWMNRKVEQETGLPAGTVVSHELQPPVNGGRGD